MLFILESFFFFTVDLIYDFVLLESTVLINLKCSKSSGTAFPQALVLHLVAHFRRTFPPFN